MPTWNGKIKLFFSKEILRISCRNENQQKSLLELKTINGHNVTVTLPWALTKEKDQVFKDDKQKKQKTFKYVISGVSTDITEDEIKAASNCLEVNRISRNENNNLVIVI